MNLIVFDVDGTLTLSNELEDDCFVEALRRLFPVGRIDDDWSTYRHVTDRGILQEFVRRHFNRPASAGEVARMRRQCAAIMAARLTGSPPVAAVPGCSDFLRLISAQPDWRTCIATGAWRATTRIKLHSAGLAQHRLAGAYADDAVSRARIVRTAIARSARRWRVDRFARVVLVGDAVWDIETAHGLGWPILAVAAVRDGAALRAAGADAVIDDYSDPAAAWHCVLDLPAGGARPDAA